MKFIFFPIALILLLILANPEGIMLWSITHLETSMFTSFLTPYILAILLSILLIISLYFITMKSLYRNMYSVFIPLIVLLLLFIKHPYENQHYENHQAVNEMTNFTEYSAFTNQRIGDDKNADLYCFFSIDCDHCLKSAVVLNAQWASGNFPNTKFIFRASKKQMNEFVLLNQIKAPHFNIESQMDFDQLAGNEFPYLVFRKDKNTADIWAGKEVNHSVFDYLKSKSK